MPDTAPSTPTARLRKDDGLGPRIRATREKKGLSLRALARQINVSPSLISQIETGRAMPSVGTLFAISNHLGLVIDDVFNNAPQVGESPEGQPVTAHSGAAAIAPTSRGPVQRSHNRSKIKLNTGVHWERLTPTTDDEVEFLYVTYDVGGASCEDGALFRHGGKEYGYILSGRLGIQIGFEEYELAPGDSLSFGAETPHRLWAIGTEPARAIFAILRRNGDKRTSAKP